MKLWDEDRVLNSMIIVKGISEATKNKSGMEKEEKEDGEIGLVGQLVNVIGRAIQNLFQILK